MLRSQLRDAEALARMLCREAMQPRSNPHPAVTARNRSHPSAVMRGDGPSPPPPPERALVHVSSINGPRRGGTCAHGLNGAGSRVRLLGTGLDIVLAEGAGDSPGADAPAPAPRAHRPAGRRRCAAARPADAALRAGCHRATRGDGPFGCDGGSPPSAGAAAGSACRHGRAATWSRPTPHPRRARRAVSPPAGAAHHHRDLRSARSLVAHRRRRCGDSRGPHPGITPL